MRLTINLEKLSKKFRGLVYIKVVELLAVGHKGRK